MSPHPPQPAAQLSNGKSPSSNTSAKLNTSAASASGTPPVIYHNVQTYIKELEISEGQLSSCIK
jgi:hypothetical protein